MRRRDVLLAGAIAPVVAPGRALAGLDSQIEDRLAALEAEVARRMASETIPAVTIGFAWRGQQWLRAYGLADVENEVPATAETAYRYASVQKSMTAVAVLQLAERGKLDLDAEIQRYVPYFPRKKWPVTARQLLGHLGGIAHYVDRDAEQHFTDRKTSRQAIAVFEAFDLVAEPGTRFSYSSYGYNLLGAAIEGASGQGYADYMREHVWQPADMASTCMDDPARLIAHRARGYRQLDGQLCNSEFIDVSSRFAAGGTRGTVPDLLRFMIALNAGRLVGRDSLALLKRPMETRGGGFSGFAGSAGYSMGWNVLSEADGGIVLQNDGGQQETRTMIVNAPGDDLVIATAQNMESDGAGAPFAFMLFEAVLGRRFPFAAD